MTDSAFLNLVRGNRVPALMGLQQDGTPKYGPSYHYIELPVGSIRKDDGTVIEDKVLRNQHVEVVAAGSIMVRGQSPVLVAYNTDLQQVANLGSMHLVHPGGERHSPSFWVTFRKDCDIASIKWAVRLYLLA
jgi:hypothetical protein